MVIWRDGYAIIWVHPHQALAFARKEWYFFLQEWRLMYGANYRN
jgi:hypothetical protein